MLTPDKNGKEREEKGERVEEGRVGDRWRVRGNGKKRGGN